MSVALLLSLMAVSLSLTAQGKVTSPKEQFGFEIGADYQLISYTQMVEYWNRLDRESERMSLVDIGKTAEGRTMKMAIVTSPENHKQLARYRDISKRLALAEGLNDEQARALAREGKAVVWIDGGLHATEVLGAQQLIEMVYQMVSMNDRETLRLLDDVILLAAITNPDGMDLIAGWYMREPEPTRRSTGGLPRLYQKYIGHDNNRDFYMTTQPETEAVNRVFYHEWFPQIIYNHHQTGPAGTVLFAPPFRDPFNYYYDPLIPMQLDLVGAAMHSRFVAEGKPGATMRSGASYSTWWNGGLRTTAYFHNMIGLLTETIGNPTPMNIGFLPQTQLPRGDLPYPVAPQRWHFRQSIDYSVTANRAVMDVAAKYREDFLYNIYQMGRNSIQKGSRDTWTVRPKMIAAVEEAIARDRGQATAERGRGAGAQAKYYEMLKDPAARDPRGYILPANQADFHTATKFVNALIKNGIVVHKATGEFRVGNKTYPAGSFVVKAAQAFRPHIMDSFEPQDHPNDIPYPGGPPRPPYDSAGWTLALQMGVEFERILDGFDGPFEKISGLAAVPAGRVTGANGAVGFLLSHQVNDSFIAVNRLLAAGEEVYWLGERLAAGSGTHPAGTIYIPAKASTGPAVQKLAAELGLEFTGINRKPAGEALKLKPVRIGLWDRYGGSMPSGWTRWLFEQFDFPFEVVYAPALDAGNLSSKFDVLVFVTGAIPPATMSEEEGGMRGGFSPQPANVPAEYQDRVGEITAGKTIPQLKKFLQDGGAILTIGSSTSLATHLGLPVRNALLEKRPDGTERPLPREKYYVPGSLLKARVEGASPLAYGLPERVNVFFQNSPTFRLEPEAGAQGVRAVAWFDSPAPLVSGWAWGQNHLDQGVAVIEADVDKGKVFLFGPEIAFRAQPHGTFKFLFNGIYYGKAEKVRLSGN